MCKKHDDAIQVAKEFIQSHKRFTYNGIVRELQKKAKCTYFSPYVHISDYLDRIVAEEILRKKGRFYYKNKDVY